MKRGIGVRGLAAVVIGLAMLTGCSSGVNAGGAKSAKTEITPMDELKAIPKDLDADIASLTKPIDDVQDIVDDLTTLPKRHGISAADMGAMTKAAFDNGTVKFKASTEVSAEAQQEVEATLKRLADVATALKQTPTKVAAIGKRIVTTTAKLPVLASQVTAVATVTSSNPFAGAEMKAKASADLKDLAQVKTDVMKSLSDAQAKIVGIPAMATGALGKLGASMTAGI